MFNLEYNLLTLLRLAALIVTLWALVDAFTRRPDAYVAAGKLTKPAWLLMLGMSLAVVFLMGPVSLLGFIAVVVMLVYFLDVRPALAAMTRKR